MRKDCKLTNVSKVNPKYHGSTRRRLRVGSCIRALKTGVCIEVSQVDVDRYRYPGEVSWNPDPKSWSSKIVLLAEKIISPKVEAIKVAEPPEGENKDLDDIVDETTTDEPGGDEVSDNDTDIDSGKETNEEVVDEGDGIDAGSVDEVETDIEPDEEIVDETDGGTVEAPDGEISEEVVDEADEGIGGGSVDEVETDIKPDEEIDVELDEETVIESTDIPELPDEPADIPELPAEEVETKLMSLDDLKELSVKEIRKIKLDNGYSISGWNSMSKDQKAEVIYGLLNK